MQLLQGDCLELMKDIPDKSVDMVLCDLPYGLTHCDWDIPLDMQSMWKQYKRIIKDNGAILLFSIQPFTSDLIQSNRKMFRYEIIWEKTQKTGFYNANKMPLKAHENILIFYKKLPTYNHQKYVVERKDIGRVRNKKADRCVLYGHVKAQDWVETGERYPHDVIHFSNWNGALFGKTDKATKHPTQKPVALYAWIFRNYAKPGMKILDTHLGSGSSRIAAWDAGLDFVGTEIDETYFNLQEERFKKHIQQPRLEQIIMQAEQESLF